MNPQSDLLSTSPQSGEPALPFALTRPVYVARVGLRARDATALAAFYRTILGLETMPGSGGLALGAGGATLLDIDPAPGAAEDDPRSAGLFHTAFLMPSRADLGRWIRLAADSGFRIDGASDHLVSEAIYLTDPEGNGIEIYADRAPEAWQWDGDTVRMATDALDIPAIVAAAGDRPAPYAAAPEGLRIGHFHLRVGDADEAEKWWRSEVGLEATAHRRGASFLSSGRYHHHVAVNSWQSPGAKARDPSRAGLSFVALQGPGIDKPRELTDPWGTRVLLSPTGP